MLSVNVTGWNYDLDLFVCGKTIAGPQVVANHGQVLQKLQGDGFDAGLDGDPFTTSVLRLHREEGAVSLGFAAGWRWSSVTNDDQALSGTHEH